MSNDDSAANKRRPNSKWLKLLGRLLFHKAGVWIVLELVNLPVLLWYQEPCPPIPPPTIWQVIMVLCGWKMAATICGLCCRPNSGRRKSTFYDLFLLVEKFSQQQQQQPVLGSVPLSKSVSGERSKIPWMAQIINFTVPFHELQVGSPSELTVSEKSGYTAGKGGLRGWGSKIGGMGMDRYAPMRILVTHDSAITEVLKGLLKYSRVYLGPHWNIWGGIRFCLESGSA